MFTCVLLADLLLGVFRLLTETKVTNEAEALAAMGRLHDKGVGTVVLSSSDLGNDSSLIAFASTRTGDLYYYGHDMTRQLHSGFCEDRRVSVILLPDIERDLVWAFYVHQALQYFLDNVFCLSDLENIIVKWLVYRLPVP